MPALNNSYLACRLFNLDEEDRPGGPFVITQEGCDPEDPRSIETIFLLRRDGTWIDELTQRELPEERRFQIFFDSVEEAAKALEMLRGPGVIERRTCAIHSAQATLAELKVGAWRLRIAVLVERYRATKHGGHF